MLNWFHVFTKLTRDTEGARAMRRDCPQTGVKNLTNIFQMGWNHQLGDDVHT